MLRAPKFDPAADLAAKLIEQIELDALAFHMDTRTLGVMIAKHLATWFEAWPHEVPSRCQASARHRHCNTARTGAAGRRRNNALKSTNPSIPLKQAPYRADNVKT